MRYRLGTIPRSLMWLILAAFLLGALAAFWARFALVQREDVHYHANFALFVDGQREEFSSFTHYEEVATCADDAANDPKQRVHMHDMVGSVVHVHDKAVTWGSFFENLGFTLGKKVLVTKDGVFIDGQDGKKLRFQLNGALIENVASEVIASEDVLLVDFSNDSEAILESRYSQIIADAGEYNRRTDPSSCSGGRPESVMERLKRTLGIGNND